MPFCTNCGKEIAPGARFCSSCGKEQTSSFETCPKCGKKLKKDEKFCSNCGTPVNADLKINKQPQPAPEKPNLTKEGRKIIDAGPKPGNKPSARKSPSAKTSPRNKSPRKKKRSPVGCFFRTIFILVSIVIGAAVLIYVVNIFIEDNENTAPDKQKTTEVNTNTGKKNQLKTQGNAISDETQTVSEKNPVAVFKNVKIDFGQFYLDGESNVRLKKFEEQVIDNECSVNIYEIELKGKNKFDDYFTISLPYNNDFIQDGTARDCVAPQYFNPKSKTWEPVFYELDTQNKVVTIFTNHLSQYGVFTVKHAQKRYAYITNVYIPDRYLNDNKKDMYVGVIENYYDNNHSLGKEALNYGLSFWGNFSGKSGVAINTLTAGGAYSTDFISDLNDGFKNLGYVASVTQLGYDLCYSDNKTTAINLTKNIMNQLVAEFGTPAINIAFIGVYFIDVALTDFGNEMLAQKYKELFQVYDYYNRTYNKRSLKEWRTLMINIHKEHADDPSAAYQEIMEEIEDYAWKFMKTTGIGTANENTAELNSLAGEAGLKRMTWPAQKDIDGVYGEEKQRIINQLFPVFTSVNKWRLYNMKLELTKEASLLAAKLNKKVKLTITENLAKGEKAKYGGYIIAIRPLNKDVDKRNWTGKLKESGVTQTTFTFIGHYTAGMPDKVEIYKPNDQPDADKPIMVKDFIVGKNNEIVIELGKMAKSKWVLYDTEFKDATPWPLVKHKAEMENGNLKASCVSPDPSSNNFSNYTMSAKWTPFKQSYMEGEPVETKASVTFNGKNVSNTVLSIWFESQINDSKPVEFKGTSKNADVSGLLEYDDRNNKNTDNAAFSTMAPKPLSRDDIWVITVSGEGCAYKMYYKPQAVNK